MSGVAARAVGKGHLPRRQEETLPLHSLEEQEGIKVEKGESEGGRVTFPKLHEHRRRVSGGKGREGGGP